MKAKIQSMIKWCKKKKGFLFVLLCLIILTILRVYMAMQIPLFAQAGADYDDFLMIKYADSILTGNWLGPFGLRTLAKGVSFSLFIVITYLLHIPYSLALILVYIGAILIFIQAIKKLIPNCCFLVCMYLVLLFSPVMLHVENTQKIYRGGLIVACALLIVGAMIGLYTRRYEKRSTLVKWSLLAGISLSFFWFLKEDSIWILPFVIGAMLIIIIDICQHKPKIDKIRSKIIITILPVILLVFANLGYCLTNYLHYGVFTVTDRTGTYFTDMIHELLLIEDEQDIKNVWITKDMMYQAIEVSPTLQSIEEEIDDMYEHSWALKDNGEIEGDLIYWSLKEAVDDAGIYDQGAVAVNEFYHQITKELQTAFKEKRLKEEQAIFLSSVAKGLTEDAIDYYAKITPAAIDTLVAYRENELSVYAATGPREDIALMQRLTNSTVVWPDELTEMTKSTTGVISLANSLAGIYQTTGWCLFILGCVGFVLLTIRMIRSITQKTYKEVSLWLITLGLFGTMLVLFIGVTWFCSFFDFTTLRYIYNYGCGLISLLQIFEIIGIYVVVQSIIMLWKNKRDRVVYKSNKIR